MNGKRDMNPTNRPTRFLLLAKGPFDTAPLTSALTGSDDAAAEIEEVHSADRIRELAERNPGQFAAAFAYYSSEADPDGREVMSTAELTSRLPLVFVIAANDLVAIHRLGRAAKCGSLAVARITPDDAQRSLP